MRRAQNCAIRAPTSGDAGALAQLRSECAQGGVSAAFRGLVPTLLTDVPFSGMMLVLYGHMRDALRAGRGRFPGGGRESQTGSVGRVDRDRER